MLHHFTQCNVQCGRRGLQHRNVICRAVDGRPSGACNLADKPPAAQPCAVQDFQTGGRDCAEGDDLLSVAGPRWKKEGNPAINGWRRLESVVATPPLLPLTPPPSIAKANDTSSSAAAATPMPPQKLVGEGAKEQQVSTEAR